MSRLATSRYSSVISVCLRYLKDDIDRRIPSILGKRGYSNRFSASEAGKNGPSTVDGHPSSTIAEVEGNVHALESLSGVDGPGLRYMIFLQGCAYRCKFCSNPNSWAFHDGDGEMMTSREIGHKLSRVAGYLTRGGGGVTLSGGEPMLQPDFAAAIFQEAHQLGLHTCIDTTGQGSRHHHWDKVLPHTDLVLLCTKSTDARIYEWITGGHRQEHMLHFAEEVGRRNIPLWLRYVLVPGITDRAIDLDWLQHFAETHPTLEMVDILPYHKLGEAKWAAMGIPYPFQGQRSPTRTELENFGDDLRQRLAQHHVQVQYAQGV